MFDDKVKKWLQDLVRNTLSHHFQGKNYSPNSIPESCQAPLGCFVTLEKNHNLRGCIGTLDSDEPLYKNVMTYTLHAALNDSRFPPLSQEELPKLSWNISVIGPLKKLERWEDLKLGTDGLQVTQNDHRAVLLPQVAFEHDFTLKEFFEQTCLKAGLDKDAYQGPDVELMIFQTHYIK